MTETVTVPREDDPPRCGNCGAPSATIMTKGEEEAFCSTSCEAEHQTLGCPLESGTNYRAVPREAEAFKVDVPEDVRKLATMTAGDILSGSAPDSLDGAACRVADAIMADRIATRAVDVAEMLRVLEPWVRHHRAIGDEFGPFRIETGRGYRSFDRSQLTALSELAARLREMQADQTAADQIAEGLQEAAAVADGSQPAASITVGGHRYVPMEELAQSGDLIEQAVREHWGERCPDFEPQCLTCLAWARLDHDAALSPLTWQEVDALHAQIAEAQDARRQGARDMREAAVQVAKAQPYYPDTHTGMRQQWVKDQIEAKIRALPLPGEAVGGEE